MQRFQKSAKKFGIIGKKQDKSFFKLFLARYNNGPVAQPGRALAF